MIVLIVDDEPLIRLGVGALLGELGHQALDAANGTKALQMLVGHPEIELMLTDFRMPGLSGLDLIEQCRDLRPDLRVIVMTGYSSTDHIFPDDCPPRLAKPFSINDLTDAIEQVS